MKTGTILSCFCFLLVCTGLSAQTNIAPLATCSTSYVSSWETLTAINDGFEPSSSSDKTHGAYGNWQSGVTNTWNWVQYTFKDYYKIARSDVYWWADGQGIVLPYSCKMMYYHPGLKTWVNVANPAGLGLDPDKYDTTTFDTILTNQIRLYFVSTVAQGILEWKVYGEKGEQIPSSSYASLAKLAKNDTIPITVRAVASTGKAVAGYQFRADVNITDNVKQTKEAYVVNGETLTETVKGLLLPPTGATGLTTFNVILPADIDPTDGIEVVVNFNEGLTQLKTYSYTETGKTPPVLKADTTQTDVDHPLEITFAADSAWQASINRIVVGNSVLNPADYQLLPGKLQLNPAAGNPLASAGTKTIYVEATGYVRAQVTQPLSAGAIDTLASSVSTQLKLFKNATVPVTVTALDRFKNPVAGCHFYWDGVVTNLGSSVLEKYTVNDTTFSAPIYNRSLPVTDANGTVIFSVSIPSLVNVGDGLQIRFRTADSLYLASSVTYKCLATEKHIYVDSKLKNYEWSYSKSAQSDNFIVFWGNLAGANPLKPASGNSNIAFNPVNILKLLENYLAYYVDTLGFITNKTTGNMAYYKFPVVITDTWDNSGYAGGYANGGSTDGVIGAMWVHPSATGGSGFVLAHEFAHMCQAMIPIQYAGKGIKDPSDGSYSLGMFWESHANFMAMTATGDIQGANPQRFVNTSMLHFSSTSHYYENNYFLQYLFDNYGMETINKIWRNATQGMHPLVSLKNNQGWSQDKLNDEFGQYALHNVTWDYSIHDKLTKILKSQGDAVVCREYTIVDSSALHPGWYVVPKYMAPADYGYNLIPIYADAAATKVTVNFYGYPNTPAGGAGWRYGFVAVDAAGKPRYSDLHSAAQGEASLDLSASDSLLYFVVTGAPAIHHNYVWTPGWPKVYRYPYRFTMSGAKPAGYAPGYNSQKKFYPGKAHSNGGGWVASTASVAATAYVGPDAQVLENASVQGNARIEGHAIVKGTATISGNAVVKGTAMVGSSAKVRENAVVDKSARVFYSSDIHGQALVTGSAIVYSSAVYGSAVVKDLAWLDGAIVYGTAIIGGDAEDFDSISAGTYLQDYGLRKGDGLTVHPLNVDINPDIDEYVTAIPEHKASDNLFQYYTGTGGQLILKSTKPAIVTFFNLSGLQVYRINISGTYTLPANQLGSRGIYLMNVRCGNEEQTYKVIE